MRRPETMRTTGLAIVALMATLMIAGCVPMVGAMFPKPEDRSWQSSFWSGDSADLTPGRLWQITGTYAGTWADAADSTSGGKHRVTGTLSLPTGWPPQLTLIWHLPHGGYPRDRLLGRVADDGVLIMESAAGRCNLEAFFWNGVTTLRGTCTSRMLGDAATTYAISLARTP